MKITLTNKNYFTARNDLIILTKFSDQSPSGELKKLDKKLKNTVSRILKTKEFKGKISSTITLDSIGMINSQEVMLIGLGSKKEFSPKNCYLAFAAAGRNLKNYHNKITVIYELDVKKNYISSAIQGLVQGGYAFNKYKSENSDNKKREINIFSNTVKSGLFNGAEKLAAIMTDAVHLARDIVNEPPVYLTPTKLAEISEKVASEGNLQIKVLDKEQIIELGMGGLHAVSRGSIQPPKFIHITYEPKIKTKRSVAVIGKGITFDSGGLCLKPADSMLTMKMDMSGASTVIGVMKAVANLKPKVRVHGIIPATENMTGGDAYKPDDVIFAMNGKSIEIINTDAEGRIALSDALSYAVKQDVDEIIDLATLTGACIVGLGSYTAGVMGNNKQLVENILDSSRSVGEKMWQLPLDEELKQEIKSKIADIKNVGSRWGGAITAALFLENFVSDKPWVHIDIAGPAYLQNGNDTYPPGGTGFGVRTVVDYLMKLK